MLQSLAQSGADVLELATDDDLLQTLMRFADLRRQRARLKVPRRFPASHVRAGTPGAGNETADSTAKLPIQPAASASAPSAPRTLEAA